MNLHYELLLTRVLLFFPWEAHSKIFGQLTELLISPC